MINQFNLYYISNRYVMDYIKHLGSKDMNNGLGVILGNKAYLHIYCSYKAELA